MPQLTLRQTKAPNIPVSPVEYSQQYQDQISNTLRLYFNQIDNFTGVLAGPRGGEAINAPACFVYDTTSQTLAAINTAKAITYDTNYFNNGVSVVNGSQLTVSADGIYSFNFNANLQSTSSSTKTVQIWIRFQGTDIEYSSRPTTISGSGTQTRIGFSFSINLSANQHIEMMWASNDTGVALQYIAPSAPYPGTASVLMGATFVSNTLDVVVGAIPAP